MAEIKTMAVKSGDSYAIINESDFDEKVHERYDGVIPSDLPNDLTRNPSGTFSTPTPTDIRFPDKSKTEFENNAGAFIGKSAAGLRDEKGLADAPGGLDPDPVLANQVKEQQKAEDADAKARASADIPDDWADMHWQKQVKLAEQITGQTDMNAAEARDAIGAEVKRRG